MMKKLFLIIVLMGIRLGCLAQIDTEFWFAAPDLEANHAQVPVRFCVVSYDSAVTVVFEQPANAFYNPQTFHLEANDCHVYDVSDIVGIVETQPYNTVLDYGFHIYSDAPVSIYYESDNNNSEIYSLKGRNALGTSFVVPMQYTYDNYYSSTCSRIEVVASENGTEVTFYPSVAIKGGEFPGHPITVTLDRGQSYAIEAASRESMAHLRNTRITATKPIAVNTSDDSVNLNGHYDLIGDQIVPVDLLGTQYIAIWNNNSSEYLYFFPTEDDTQIYLNGSTDPLTTLDVGEEYAYRINSAVVYINANHPLAVFQLSSNSLGEMGGTVLPQISCTGSRKTVYKRQNNSNLVVTLIVGTSYTDGFRLNGDASYLAAADFHPVPANPDFSYCKKDVTSHVMVNGLMTVENIYDEGYFHLGIMTGLDGTWNYGYFSDYQPYAFAEFQMDDTYCSGQDIEFVYATENVSNLVLVLPNGDEVQLPYVLSNAQPQHSGQYSLRGEDCNGVHVLDVLDLTVSGPGEKHVFLEGCNSVVWHGHSFNHSIDSTWLTLGAGPDGCDSIYQLHFTVYPPNDTLIADPIICVGDTYNFHGTLYDQDGQIAYFDTIDDHGCLKVEKLMLSVDEIQMPLPLNQYECYASGTIPGWTWDKTGITYHEDTYDEIVLDDPNGGCPIMHRLFLKFHEEFYHEESKEVCGSYYWPISEQTYYESQDPIKKTFHVAFGDKECDSTYVLHLVIDNLLHPSEIFPVNTNNLYPHWVVPATEFQINSYEFSLYDTISSEPWDSVKWEFEDPEVEWILERDTLPFLGKKCKMYVLNYIEDTIWLRATPYNPCDTIGQTSQRYWFVCSFYGLEEDGPSTGSRNFDFSVVPNPNNGTMTINFEKLTGKIDLKVYDMKGILIDDFSTCNIGGSESLQYDMKHRAEGIYLFVATGKEATVSKKVIIK